MPLCRSFFLSSFLSPKKQLLRFHYTFLLTKPPMLACDGMSCEFFFFPSSCRKPFFFGTCRIADDKTHFARRSRTQSKAHFLLQLILALWLWIGNTETCTDMFMPRWLQQSCDMHSRLIRDKRGEIVQMIIMQDYENNKTAFCILCYVSLCVALLQLELPNYS